MFIKSYGRWDHLYENNYAVRSCDTVIVTGYHTEQVILTFAPMYEILGWNKLSDSSR